MAELLDRQEAETMGAWRVRGGGRWEVRDGRWERRGTENDDNNNHGDGEEGVVNISSRLVSFVSLLRWSDLTLPPASDRVSVFYPPFS